MWPGTHRLVYDEGWLAALLRRDRGSAGHHALHLLGLSRRGAGRPDACTCPRPPTPRWASGRCPPPRGEELEEARRRLLALPDGAAPGAAPPGRLLAQFPREVSGDGRRLPAHAAPVGAPRTTRWRGARTTRGSPPRAKTCGAARATTRTGTASSAAATCRISGAPSGSALLAAERRLDDALGAPGSPGRATTWTATVAPRLRVRTPELAVTLRPGRGRHGDGARLPPARSRYSRGVHPAPRDVSRPRQGKRWPRRPAARSRPSTPLRGPRKRVSRSCSTTTRSGARRFSTGSSVPGRLPIRSRRGLRRGGHARAAMGERPMACEIVERGGEVELALGPTALDGLPLAVEKRIRIGAAGAGLRVRYRLAWRGDEALEGTWAVQLNLALTAGDAPGRYYRLPGSPSLGSRGSLAQRGELSPWSTSGSAARSRSHGAARATSAGRRSRRCRSPKPDSSGSTRARPSSSAGRWRWLPAAPGRASFASSRARSRAPAERAAAAAFPLSACDRPC